MTDPEPIYSHSYRAGVNKPWATRGRLTPWHPLPLLGLAVSAVIVVLVAVMAKPVSASSVTLPPSSPSSSSGAPDYLSIMLMAREGQLEQVAEQLKAELERDRSNLSLANRLAIIYAALGRIEESREALETALASNAVSAKTFENLKVLAGIQFARSYAQALGQPVPPNPQGLETLDGDGLQVGALKQQLLAFEQAKAKAEAERLSAERLAAQQRAAEKLAAERAARAREDASARAVEKMLTQWARAWSSVDFERYAGFYDVSFSNDRFKTRADWLAFRKPRIVGKSSIRVELSDIEVQVTRSNQGLTRAKARFSQRYESGRLRLNARKEMDLVYRGNQWFIQSEGN